MWITCTHITKVRVACFSTNPPFVVDIFESVCWYSSITTFVAILSRAVEKLLLT